MNYWKQAQKAFKSSKGYLTISCNLSNTNNNPNHSSVNNQVDYPSGIIDWLATNGNSLFIEHWINPATVGLVSVAASTNNPVKGRALSVLGPHGGSLIGRNLTGISGVGVVIKPKSHGNNKNNDKSQTSEERSDSILANKILVRTMPWIAFDMGLQLVPTAYTLAYLRHAKISSHNLSPRNWQLEVSVFFWEKKQKILFYAS